MLKAATGLLLALLLIASGCGEDSPTAPKVDPMEAMFGTYQGTFTFRFTTGGYSQDPLTLTLGRENSATMALSGAFHPTTVTHMSTSTVGLSVNFIGTTISMQGSRSGNTLNGTSAVTGMGQGTWTATK